jgi:PAS domain S-box-containing protein
MSKLTLAQPNEEASPFHLLVDTIQDYAIFALDREGRIESWNRGAQQINGYRPDEVVGRDFALLFSEEDRKGGRPAHLLRLAAEQGRVEDEGWRVRKGGARFWANAVITALRSSDGELVGFAKVTRDLSERRAAEQALRLRERQLSDTQALAGLGSWEWDVRADRVTWTDELYRMYGLQPQVFGATFAAYLERVHPDDRDRVQALVLRALREGDTFEFEERIVRPDGSIRVLRSRGRTFQNETGGTTHLIGACLDITELKRAEEQAVALAREQAARQTAEATAAGLRFLVRASEVLSSSLNYEATLHNVAELAVPAVADWCAVDFVEPDGTLRRVVVAHPDTAKIELATRYMERYPPQRDPPSGAWRVIDSREPEYYPDITDEMLVAGIPDPEQLAMLRELGLRSSLTVPLVGRSGPLGALTLVQAESGRRLGENDVWIAQELGRHAAVAIENARLHQELADQNVQLAEQSSELEVQAEELQTQTVTQEALLEELQKRTAEAEKANRAKLEFLAAMSHELRTPLTAIFGYAELLQMGIHGPINPAQQEALGRIKRNQQVLLSLINDVLNFAKLEAGRLELDVVEVSVADLVADLEKVVGPQLRAKGLHYRCVPCRQELRVWGERERIEQILLNLLTNSIKFTEPGGQITLLVETDEEIVRIGVRDTGRGIPSDRLESVFDPFVQIDRQLGTPDQRGVGLGLAISRDLAEAMGGTLSVESVAGEGSVFTLALAAAPPA